MKLEVELEERVAGDGLREVTATVRRRDTGVMLGVATVAVPEAHSSTQYDAGLAAVNAAMEKAAAAAIPSPWWSGT